MLEDTLRVIFEYSPIAHCLLDSNGAFIDVNEAAAKLLGCSRKELRGKKFSELNIITPHQLAKLESSINNWKMGQPSGPNEYILNRKEGSQVFVESWSFPVKSGDQNLALTMVIDLTERVRAEEALKKSEKEYKTLVEHIPQKIFIKDRRSVYISCNENYARDLNLKPDEIGGKTDYDFYPKELAKKYRKDDRRIIDSGETEEIEEQYIQDGRNVWVHTIKTPLKDENKNIIGLLGIFWDITRRKQAEEALKNFSRRILSIREEEKKKISENIHREVGYITGALNLLADSVEKKIRSSDLEGALEASWKFKSTFHDFISNIRRLALDLRPPELDILGLASALSNYFSNIEKETGLKIEFHANVDEKKMGDDLPIVLFRIAQEAVNNVLKHSRAKRAGVALRFRNGRITLAVRDNGQGFDVSRTGHEGEPSMGLRLIREMTESLDGTFEINSRPGKGTELFVSLPARPPRPPKRPAPLPAPPAPSSAHSTSPGRRMR